MRRCACPILNPNKHPHCSKPAGLNGLCERCTEKCFPLKKPVDVK